MAGLSGFFDGIIPSGWIGTVVAHVLLSPMKLVGAAVSKTACAGSTPALGDTENCKQNSSTGNVKDCPWNEGMLCPASECMVV